MSCVVDGITWKSEGEAVYYNRIKGWLQDKPAIVTHNSPQNKPKVIAACALLLSTLVSSYVSHNADDNKEDKRNDHADDEDSDGSDEETKDTKQASTVKKARETEGALTEPGPKAIANEVAAYLVQNSIIQEEGSRPVCITVSDICSYCIELLGDEEPPYSKAQSFYWMTTARSRQHVEDQRPMLKFCTFLIGALRELLYKSKVTVEALCDFDYVWKLAYQTPQVKEALERSLDTPDQIQQCAWKLACLCIICLNKASRDTEGRRYRLLISSSCIAFLCALPAVQASPATVSPERSRPEVDDQGDESATEEEAVGTGVAAGQDVFKATEFETPFAEKAKVNSDEFFDKAFLQRAADTASILTKKLSQLIGRKRRSTEAVSSPKRTKTSSMEEEAIAALGMMLVAPVSPSKKEQPPPSPSPGISTRECITIVTESANTLHSRLSMTLLDQDMGLPLRRQEIEHELINLLPPIVSKMEELMLSDHNLQDLSSSGLIDAAIRSQGNQQVQNKLLPPHFVPVRFIDDSALVEDDQYASKIFCTTTKAAETGSLGKRPAALILEYTQDDERITISTQTQVADVIASLTSASQHVDKTTAVRAHIGLNEWCVSILKMKVAKPSSRLLIYLKASDDLNRKERTKVVGWRHFVVSILNSVVFSLTEEKMEGEETEPMLVSRECGQVELDDANNPDKRLCLSVILLYYHALENILHHETSRLKKVAHPSLVRSESFHRGVLACCYLCIVKAFGENNQVTGTHSGPHVMAILARMESTPYSFLRVSGFFRRAMESDAHLPGLPDILLSHISHCEVISLDSFIWMKDTDHGAEGSIMKGISELQVLQLDQDGRANLRWPTHVLEPALPEEREDYESAEDLHPITISDQLQKASPNQRYAVYVVRKLLQVVYSRISVLCNALKIPEELPVASQTWIAFRFMMRHHVELLLDRHVDQLLLCALFAVCKMLKYEPDLTFSKIIEAYTKVRGDELGEKTCSHIVRHIRLLDGESEGSQKKFGNIIQLYNQVFVPDMKQHLLQSQSLKRATKWMESYSDGRDGRASQGSESFVPFHEGDLTVFVRFKRPNHSRNSKPGKWTAKLTPKMQAAKQDAAKKAAAKKEKHTRTRLLYSFGDPVRDDLDLVNKMLRSYS